MAISIEGHHTSLSMPRQSRTVRIFVTGSVRVWLDISHRVSCTIGHATWVPPSIRTLLHIHAARTPCGWCALAHTHSACITHTHTHNAIRRVPCTVAQRKCTHHTQYMVRILHTTSSTLRIMHSTLTPANTHTTHYTPHATHTSPRTHGTLGNTPTRSHSTDTTSLQCRSRFPRSGCQPSQQRTTFAARDNVF